MGGGSFNISTYRKQAAAAAERSFDAGFTAESMCDEFNPKLVSTRHSKKGPFNGFRNVITALIGLDVTGSMGDIPRDLLKGKLGSLMMDLKQTYNRPNENLQISFAGIGDSLNDDAPLQVTHFESDNRFAQQLQKIWLEGHGGGNGAESYNLLWWYAANKTQLNYVMEEERKGILITVGDDNVHPKLTVGEIQKYLDPNYTGGDISNQKLLEAAREQYDVYHIIVTDGQSFLHDILKEKPKSKDQQNAEISQWKSLLGADNIVLVESAGVAEAIANIIKRHRPVVKASMLNLTNDEWDKKNKENLTDPQWLEILSYAICPLTGNYMTQPGDWNGGKRAFEKEYVINHVRSSGTDPITNNPLALANLNFKINSNLAQLCDDYRPYFLALPDSRRSRLVQLTLNSMKSSDKSAVVSTSNSTSSALTAASAAILPVENLGLFAHKPSAVQSSSAALEKDEDNIPRLFICPISLQLMVRPVVAEDGCFYDQESLENWFKGKTTAISPKKGFTMGPSFTPADDLRSEILEWQRLKQSKSLLT